MICTRNRPEELNQCLEALKRLNYPRFEVLVVDNAPTGNRTREVAPRWGARCVVEPVVGLSRAQLLAGHEFLDLPAKAGQRRGMKLGDTRFVDSELLCDFSESHVSLVVEVHNLAFALGDAS